MRHLVPLNAKVHPADRDQVQSLALTFGVSMSAVIRQLISDSVDDPPHEIVIARQPAPAERSNRRNGHARRSKIKIRSP